ncbi:hypothetical protein M6B38_389475 [Iris pallida]|uniref:Uncharacterized protein n=1 Tax=Iris pallida TaxID=29817 RepID=A0AAX6G2N1_IRIPA|nr:hypothetical protein M6B38_389475 [Iris pallida]
MCVVESLRTATRRTNSASAGLKPFVDDRILMSRRATPGQIDTAISSVVEVDIEIYVFLFLIFESKASELEAIVEHDDTKIQDLEVIEISFSFIA